MSESFKAHLGFGQHLKAERDRQSFLLLDLCLMVSKMASWLKMPSIHTESHGTQNHIEYILNQSVTRFFLFEIVDYS